MSRLNQLAACLLFVGVSRNYGWLLVDPAQMGVASKGLGSLAAIALLYLVWKLLPTMSLVLGMVIGWYAFEESQTAICSAMYLIEPWHVEAGQSMCSARIGFDIGTVGIFVVGLIVMYLVNQDGKK